MIVGDYGVQLTFVVKEDGQVVNLTGATVNLIIKWSSNSTRIVKPCEVHDPESGIAFYVTKPGDFPSAETYKLALEVTFSNTHKFYTSPVSIAVSDNI